MISKAKDEPQWMLEFRLKALDIFYCKPMPTWGADLSGLNLDEIYYYIKPEGMNSRSWDDVPDDVKKTFERSGHPRGRAGRAGGRGRAVRVVKWCTTTSKRSGKSWAWSS